jgi:predicted nuclease with TOPRIM domain
VDQLARISATLGYKAVITGKAPIEKLRSKEDDLLRVSSDIALKKELSRLKEENASLEKIRKLRKEEVADLKKKNQESLERSSREVASAVRGDGEKCAGQPEYPRKIARYY